jgi:branched-chain amino acid transport system ATP-binding protein
VALLEVSRVTKRFGGITAVDNVSITVEAHEAVGLVGPNGAGKTTLFNCLLGLLRPDGGSVVFDGHDLAELPIYRRARLGIGRTFQRMELFSEMSAREHLMVAERARRGDGSLWRDLLNRAKPTADENARVDAIIELLGIEDVANLSAEALSLGHGRLVELGRAIATEPSLLLLDEPSSGLDRTETEALGVVLDRVRAERGVAVLLVEHDLEMVTRAVDRLYVLDFGQLLASGPTGEVLANADVRRAYLGQAS